MCVLSCTNPKQCGEDERECVCVERSISLSPHLSIHRSRHVSTFSVWAKLTRHIHSPVDAGAIDPTAETTRATMPAPHHGGVTDAPPSPRTTRRGANKNQSKAEVALVKVLRHLQESLRIDSISLLVPDDMRNKRPSNEVSEWSSYSWHPQDGLAQVAGLQQARDFVPRPTC